MNRPTRIEGAESSTSLMNRTVLPYRLSPAYSASQVPARMPKKRAMAIARLQSMIEPTIALRSPPRDPAGGVSMVKMSSDIPARPFWSRVHSTAARNVSAMAVTKYQKPTNTLFWARRTAMRAAEAAIVLYLRPADHHPRHRENDEGDDEEDKARGEQSGGMHGA